MDIKELIERVKLTPEEMLTVIYGIPAREPGEDYSRLMEATAQAQLNKVLDDPNLALIIREGDTVPLGVETATHVVILLKEALKEVNK